MSLVPLVERAAAKINLTLRVLGRRTDGYHEIESLVVFASLGDRLSFVPGGDLALRVVGPTAPAAGELADNLVLKAAAALAQRVPGIALGQFRLDKRLPVAAGLGGGSADAAAALRLLARANRLATDDPRLYAAAGATGADVPVCLDPRPRMMRGIGEVLSAPLDVPALQAVLVNPGTPVATRDVFARLRAGPAPQAVARGERAVPSARDVFLDHVRADTNDLESPAITLAPAIAQVLAALRACPGCELARMSGSGATCFGLFASRRAAAAAAAALHAAHPCWWVRASVLGSAR